MMIVPSNLVLTGVHLNFMCGVGKTNHNDEPYIKPVRPLLMLLEK